MLPGSGPGPRQHHVNVGGRIVVHVSDEGVDIQERQQPGIEAEIALNTVLEEPSVANSLTDCVSPSTPTRTSVTSISRPSRPVRIRPAPNGNGSS